MIVPLMFTSDIIIFKISNGYWFLETLFKISIIFVIIGYMSSKWRKSEVPLILLANFSIVFLFLYKGTMPYIWFYSLGYLMHKSDWGRFYNKWMAAIAFIVFSLCSHFFVHDSIISYPYQVWIKMTLSVLAIVFCYHLFSQANEASFVLNKLSEIGKYTLGIYLAQNYLLDVRFLAIDYASLGNSTLLVIFTAIAIIISYLCIVIQKVVESNQVLGFIFYGKRFKIRNEKI